MDEARFEKLAGEELAALEARLRDQDGLEADLANGILTLELDDGGPNIVVNSHAAARQIWVAANLAAAHFGYDEKTSRWFDTRTGEEFRQKLGSLVSVRVGRRVTL
ncbi:MAG: iron donor protein CyaY [Deltaproteobacteria bacterium]|nr:MAG: iron donor protein CyaY [Deltaproteobacteria bacterium]TMB31842.1 MAG: iron donor protein CyaY [Deltaproteobacteria bacterium]